MRVLLGCTLAMVSVIAFTASPAIAAPNGKSAHVLNLTIVGNDGECSLTSHATFKFRVTGAAPGHKIMILPFYPPGVKAPVYANPIGYYWYQQNFGAYIVPKNGVVLTAGWQCWIGPNGSQDPPGGPYSAFAIDVTAQHKTHFTVTP